jgi:hypothetical protein
MLLIGRVAIFSQKITTVFRTALDLAVPVGRDGMAVRRR